MREKMIRLSARATSVMLIFMLACVEPFSPPAIKSEGQRIVIDGFLDYKEQALAVSVFYTQALSDPAHALPVESATVRVEDDTGVESFAYYAGDGVYRQDLLTVDPSKTYRIVVTEGAHSYASEFVPVMQTPPIDSLTYDYDQDYLYVYVHAHDPAGQVKFYRWNYDETWAYTSRFRSGWEVIDTLIVPRKQDIFHCWQMRRSTSINLQNTEKLTSAVVRYHLIAAIPYASIKLSSKYSILTRQFAIPEKEFAFWKQLAGTTENLGSLFDAQPSQVRGNIIAQETGDPVIGYFSAGSAEEQRLTINTDDLPFAYRLYYYGHCSSIDYDTVEPQDAPFISSSQRLLYPIYEGINLIGYARSSQNCADCTIWGGTNAKPDYW